MIELLRCPFCYQNKPTIIKSDSDGVQICCGWCGARGPTSGEEEDAKSYWNNRVMSEPEQKFGAAMPAAEVRGPLGKGEV